MKATAKHTDYKVLYEQQAVVIADLTHQLEQLKKLVFGKKSERFVPADNSQPTIQLSLDLDADTIAACKITEASKVSYVRTKTELVEAKPKSHPGRMQLPASLRREVILVQPEGDVSGLKKIGDEVTEVLELIPGELFVKQYIRPKYVQPAATDSSMIITATLPGRLLAKCMAGEGLLAQIIIDKYCDHLPLHRQLQRFERAGITIAQSTINDWVKAVLTQLTALYEVHKKQVLISHYLHADETPLKVLDNDKKDAAHQGYYWCYHNSIAKLALFDYRRGRGREGPDDILKDFKGYLQTDGYVAYDAFDKREGITLLNCMAHARRKFFDAQTNDQARAEHALNLFSMLYSVERDIREQQLPAAEALALRQVKSVPVLQQLKDWMVAEYPKVTPKSPVGQAIGYCLPRWDKLSIYTTDGVLNIDNNPVENAIRPIAIGRKNYLFAGSHEAAQRAAMVYSLLATCRMHNINPYTWLHDILQRMHLYTTSNIHQLLPQNWKSHTTV